MFSLLLGLTAIVLAITTKDLLQMILIAQAFYMPIVTVPLMLTILGFRSSKTSVLIGMIAGFITVLSWKIIGIKTDCIVFAMLINLTFLVGSHYILRQPGGGIKIEKEQVNIITSRSYNLSSLLLSLKI